MPASIHAASSFQTSYLTAKTCHVCSPCSSPVNWRLWVLPQPPCRGEASDKCNKQIFTSMKDTLPCISNVKDEFLKQSHFNVFVHLKARPRDKLPDSFAVSSMANVARWTFFTRCPTDQLSHVCSTFVLRRSRSDMATRPYLQHA